MIQYNCVWHSHVCFLMHCLLSCCRHLYVCFLMCCLLSCCRLYASVKMCLHQAWQSQGHSHSTRLNLAATILPARFDFVSILKKMEMKKYKRMINFVIIIMCHNDEPSPVDPGLPSHTINCLRPGLCSCVFFIQAIQVFVSRTLFLNKVFSCH